MAEDFFLAKTQICVLLSDWKHLRKISSIMLKLFLLHRQNSFLYAYECLVFKYVIAKYAFKILLIFDSE